MVARRLCGWSFGDGHLHDERLLRSVQERCPFEPGELIHIFVESQPLHRQAVEYRITDAATGLVYICNPHNPTGSLTRRQDLDVFLGQLPQGVHVIVDEAYHDFVGGASDYRSLIDRTDDPRVIVTRSFSKMHGLAGLRIGYAIAARSTAAMLQSHTSSDDINIVAARGAQAALADPDHVRASVIRFEDERRVFCLRGGDEAARTLTLTCSETHQEGELHWTREGRSLRLEGMFDRHRVSVLLTLRDTAELPLKRDPFRWTMDG